MDPHDDPRHTPSAAPGHSVSSNTRVSWATLATMLLLTFAGVALGEGNIVPFTLVTAIGLFSPVVLTIIVVFGRGPARVFCIGALFPSAIAFALFVCISVVCTFDGWDKLDQVDGLRGGFFIIATTWLAAGALAVVLQRYLQSGMFEFALGRDAEWQFSLAALLGFMTLCALAFTVLFILPGALSVSILALLGLLAPVCITVGIVYGRPFWRVFCIGAAFPAALTFSMAVCLCVAGTFSGHWLDGLGDPDVVFGVRLISCVAALAMAGCGRLAIAVREHVKG